MKRASNHLKRNFGCMAVGLLTLLLCLSTYFFWVTPEKRVLGSLPPGVECVNSATIRVGIDTSYLFEVSGSEPVARKYLVEHLNLIDISETDRQPMSVKNRQLPTWWPQRWPDDVQKFAFFDQAKERYASAWSIPEQTSFYVEVGQW